jgi:hypothetical protein
MISAWLGIMRVRPTMDQTNSAIFAVIIIGSLSPFLLVIFIIVSELFPDWLSFLNGLLSSWF